MNIPNKSIVLWNLRSLHNVGAITRSAVGFGVTNIVCIGSTPYPVIQNDTRLPHVSQRATKQIAKTALGAEKHASFSHLDSIEDLIISAKSKDIATIALEQYKSSKPIEDYKVPEKWMLIVGEETAGLPKSILSNCDVTIEIHLPGPKSSLNVSAASAIALFALTKG